MLRVLVFASLLLLVGFGLVAPVRAEVSAPNCAGADWRAIGFSDGADRGSTEEGQSHLREHVEICGEAVNAYAYEGGFIDGLREFCTPEHGFAMARAGETYGGLCHADQADAFGAALASGQEVHVVSSQLVAVQQRKDALFVRRREITQEAREAEGAMGQMRPCTIGLCPDRPGAVRWQREQAEFRAESARVEAALHEAENLIPELEGRLARLRSTIGNQYGEW
jgi:hypothetical protein